MLFVVPSFSMSSIHQVVSHTVATTDTTQKESGIESVGSNIPIPLAVNRERKHRKMATRQNSTHAQWPEANEILFINICSDYQKKFHLLNNNSFTQAIWKEIVAKLNEHNPTHHYYEIDQVKAKWHRIRRSWKRYFDMLNNMTGLGINNETGEITGEPSNMANMKELDKPEFRLLTKNRDFFDKCTTLFKRSTATGGLGSSGPTFPDIGGMNLSSGQGGQTSRPVLIDADDTPTWSDGGMSSGSKRSYGAEGGSSRRKRGKNNDNLSKNEFVDCLDAVLAKNVEVMKP